MKSKSMLMEQASHGTPLLPIGIHRLHYSGEDDVFFYLHWHSEIEFFIVQRGAVVFTIEDQEYILNENEGIFVNANELHMARSHNGMECQCCALVFQPVVLIDNVNSPAYAKYVYPVLVGNRILVHRLGTEEVWQQEVLNGIKAVCAMPDDALEKEELWVRSELLKIWNLCYHHPNRKISQEACERRNYKLKRMEPVMQYISHHYQEDISLQELASMIPMSEGQFCRSFKEIMHMTPIAYVVRLRIMRSCTLLEETDLKIGEIAQQVGFGNISYFNREFLKVIGCPPGVYRRKNTETE
ncbi:MAG: AraC family transcriptional regulator [bacterium]|nr:AraC family transcriptional regulator [bacterium]